MAHLIPVLAEKVHKKTFKLPKVEGRIGFSFYVGVKEIFLGVAINDVITERIVRKKFIKTTKATTRTFGFDTFANQDTSNEDL